MLKVLSNDNKIDRLLKPQTIVKLMIAEKFNLKTLEYDIQTKDLKIVKQVRLADQISQIEVIDNYKMILITYENGNIQAIALKGSLIYEQK